MGNQFSRPFFFNINIGKMSLAGLFAAIFFQAAWAADPMASNNGLYPEPEEYEGRFLLSNLDYPSDPPSHRWPLGGGVGQLTTENAGQYALALKAYLEPTLRTLVEDSQSWDPAAAGWYDLVWSGAGEMASDHKTTDPNSGREAIMNTYTGQIMPAETFFPAEFTPSVDVQNHAVIYYDGVAASMLYKIWKNIYSPDMGAIDFPDGSVVVKAEAVTPAIEEWPAVLKGASSWKVFRPTVADQTADKNPLKPQVIEVHPFQLAIKIKDPVASPTTGWVFMALVYNAASDGATPWDRFVPVGVMWGNDPEFARYPNGRAEGKPLVETWLNPDRPEVTNSTLGWGERLAGPMDVATRHNVVTPSGKRFQGADHLRASSCLSCHGASEYPFTANLYPSPNKSFPRDGSQFMLYDPGSAEWARWFQSRPGDEPMTKDIGVQALDYDMAIMFALSANAGAVGKFEFVEENLNGH